MLLTCLAALLLLLAAGSNGRAGIAEGAGHVEAELAADRVITVYTALEVEQVRPLLDDFRKSHPGIDVRIVRDSHGVITARFLAEADNPRADVLWNVAVTSLTLAQSRGLLEPYAPADLAQIDPMFRDPVDPPSWVAGDAWMTAIACNTVELAKRGIPVPTGYDDLLDPRLKGLVTMPNPASSGTGFLTVSAILQLMGEEKGWAYLDKLHLNIASYEHSGSKPAKMAASGECAVGISFCYASLQQKAKGAPLVVVFPKEGSGWEMEATSLVKKPGINPAARTFVDWASSRSAVTLYGRTYAVLSRKDVVSDRKGYPADLQKQMIRNDLKWAADNRERIIDTWSKRYGSGR